MSAYIVSKAHIDALVTVAIDMRGQGSPDFDFYDGTTRVKVTTMNASEIGAMLVGTCVESVSYRYPDDDVQAGELPGPADAYYLHPYEYLRTREFIPAEVRDLVRGYEYQSCEHPGWAPSPAWYFCQALRDRLLDRLPGVSKARDVEAEDVGYGTRTDICLTDLMRRS